MGKGFLESWLDGLVEKVEKVVREEGIPALLKVDKVLDVVEHEARTIKERSVILLAEAERERDRVQDGVVDAEVVESENEK